MTPDPAIALACRLGISLQAARARLARTESAVGHDAAGREGEAGPAQPLAPLDEFRAAVAAFFVADPDGAGGAAAAPCATLDDSRTAVVTPSASRPDGAAADPPPPPRGNRKRRLVPGRVRRTPDDEAPPIAVASDEDPQAEAEAMRQMWCAVLQRQLDDARGITGGGQCPVSSRRLSDAARTWFARGGADLWMVCHPAGLDPDAVLGRLPRLIARAA